MLRQNLACVGLSSATFINVSSNSGCGLSCAALETVRNDKASYTILIGNLCARGTREERFSLSPLLLLPETNYGFEGLAKLEIQPHTVNAATSFWQGQLAVFMALTDFSNASCNVAPVLLNYSDFHI